MNFKNTTIIIIFSSIFLFLLCKESTNSILIESNWQGIDTTGSYLELYFSDEKRKIELGITYEAIGIPIYYGAIIKEDSIIFFNQNEEEERNIHKLNIHQLSRKKMVLSNHGILFEFDRLGNEIATEFNFERQVSSDFTNQFYSRMAIYRKDSSLLKMTTLPREREPEPPIFIEW